MKDCFSFLQVLHLCGGVGKERAHLHDFIQSVIKEMETNYEVMNYITSKSRGTGSFKSLRCYMVCFLLHAIYVWFFRHRYDCSLGCGREKLFRLYVYMIPCLNKGMVMIVNCLQ